MFDGKYADSSELTQRQNDVIKNRLKSREKSLCTCVIQLCTFDRKRDEWATKKYGALCLIKKSNRYSFKLYDINTGVTLWQHECVNNVKYIRITSHFTQFNSQSQDTNIGFNFDSEVEANQFHNILRATNTVSCFYGLKKSFHRIFRGIKQRASKEEESDGVPQKFTSNIKTVDAEKSTKISSGSNNENFVDEEINSINCGIKKKSKFHPEQSSPLDMHNHLYRILKKRRAAIKPDDDD